MSEPMARQFGDFLGKFLDYDTSIPSSSNRNYMRIRVRPSFTWRSICSARELMVEELVWRVGSGDRINIWNDSWLPGIMS